MGVLVVAVLLVSAQRARDECVCQGGNEQACWSCPGGCFVNGTGCGCLPPPP